MFSVFVNFNDNSPDHSGLWRPQLNRQPRPSRPHRAGSAGTGRVTRAPREAELQPGRGGGLGEPPPFLLES